MSGDKLMRPVAVIIPHGGGGAQREVQQIMWVLRKARGEAS